jgi:hypothetical protein
VDTTDEVFHHLLGDGEIGDDAVLHWADGCDVGGCAAKHALGFQTNGKDGLLAGRTTFLADGDD